MKVDLDQLVSPKKAAEMRDVTSQAIHHLMKRGRFTIVEISGKKFLLRKEVETFEPDVGGRPRTKTEGKTITKQKKKR